LSQDITGLLLAITQSF